MKFNKPRRFFFRKTALDEWVYKLSAGRSMVEMLGVLAIIGVLSVGAIAGYSKAMMKYKLNKQTEQITQILNGMIEYKSIIKDNSVTELLMIYKKLKIIPIEMIKNTSGYIYDALGNSIYFYKGSDFSTYVLIGNDTREACINSFNLTKGYAEHLYAVGFFGTNSDDEQQEGWFYGNKICNKSTFKCLYQMNVDTLWNLCNKCLEGNRCQMYYVFKPDLL